MTRMTGFVLPVYRLIMFHDDPVGVVQVCGVSAASRCEPEQRGSGRSGSGSFSRGERVRERPALPQTHPAARSGSQPQV